MEVLLSRLQSLDAHSLCVRFGHDTVELCDYCLSFADFALFALSATTLTHLPIIVLVEPMTVKGSGTRRLSRSWGVGILVAAAEVKALSLWTFSSTMKIEVIMVSIFTPIQLRN